MRYLKASVFIALLCAGFAWGQFPIPEKPVQQTGVYDYVSLLSDHQRNTLQQKLRRYADSTSTQLVIALIASTQGEDITFLGAQWGQQWGIGQADTDNGVLILLAQDDRQIAINTGYGVEGALTDLMARRIIETVMLPAFKKGDYYNGLDKGVDAIVGVLQGEFTTEGAPSKDSGVSLQALGPLLFIIIVLILLFKRRNRGGGNGNHRGGGPDVLDVLILSSLGRSSGSSGGFGSGGFSGVFGGGSFGGGGASGGW